MTLSDPGCVEDTGHVTTDECHVTWNEVTASTDPYDLGDSCGDDISDRV